MLRKVDFQVKIYLGQANRRFNQIVPDIETERGGNYLCLLIDSEFDIILKIELDSIEKNLISLNKRLSFSRNKHGHVDTLGLICVNIFQFMCSTKLIKCMRGLTWELLSDIVPFGEINHFLYDHQIKPINFKTTVSQNNYLTIIKELPKCPEQEVNFILNARVTYPDKIPDIFYYVSSRKKCRAYVRGCYYGNRYNFM